MDGNITQTLYVIRRDINNVYVFYMLHHVMSFRGLKLKHDKTHDNNNKQTTVMLVTKQYPRPVLAKINQWSHWVG